MVAKIKYKILIFVCVLFFCASANAAEVVIQNNTLIAEGITDEYGVGAFDIILVPDPGISLKVAEWMAPYMGAINAESGIIKIGGATGDLDAPNGNVPLVAFNSEGSGSVFVYVNGLYNTMGDKINVDNALYEGDSDTTPVTTSKQEVDSSDNRDSYISYSQHFENMTESEPLVKTEENEEIIERDVTEPTIEIVSGTQMSETMTEVTNESSVENSVEKTFAGKEVNRESPVNFVLIIVSVCISLIIAKAIYE